MVRGGGNFGTMLRGFERMGRDADKERRHAANLAPLEQQQKAFIDAAVLNLDQGITTLEGYILQQQGSS